MIHNCNCFLLVLEKYLTASGIWHSVFDNSWIISVSHSMSKPFTHVHSLHFSQWLLWNGMYTSYYFFIINKHWYSLYKKCTKWPYDLLTMQMFGAHKFGKCTKYQENMLNSTYACYHEKIILSLWAKELSGLTQHKVRLNIVACCDMSDKRKNTGNKAKNYKWWMNYCSNKSKNNNWYSTENGSNLAVTCVGIIPEESINCIINHIYYPSDQQRYTASTNTQ